MNMITRILIGIGTLITGILGLLALSKNETVGERLKQHHAESMQAGREAATDKRRELEVDLARMMSDEAKK